MNTYSKLDKSTKYDIEVVREYAEARNEIAALKLRLTVLSELVYDNEDMKDTVWTTAEGKCSAIHDLEDDHLKNIVTWLREHRQYNKGIAAEYTKRFGEAPLLPAPAKALRGKHLARAMWIDDYNEPF